MNCGLGNLNDLQSWLLPVELQGDAVFATQLPIVGIGVLGMLETYCNRRFTRLVGDQFETNADRLVIILPRYPIETITAVEVRSQISQGWQDQGNPDDLLFNRRDSAGIVDLGGWLGGRYQRLRFTYTGGYWFETLEPTDVGYPSTMPAGANPLPGDLKMAWLQQCVEVWKMRPKLGVPVTAAPLDARTQALLARSLDALPLTPEVQNLLRVYTRYSMT